MNGSFSTPPIRTGGHLVLKHLKKFMGSANDRALRNRPDLEAVNALEDRIKRCPMTSCEQNLRVSAEAGKRGERRIFATRPLQSVVRLPARARHAAI